MAGSLYNLNKGPIKINIIQKIIYTDVEFYLSYQIESNKNQLTLL